MGLFYTLNPSKINAGKISVQFDQLVEVSLTRLNVDSNIPLNIRNQSQPSKE